MAKETYDLKQVNLPTEAHKNMQAARDELKSAGIKTSMAELWIEASQYALGAARNKVIDRQLGVER